MGRYHMIFAKHVTTHCTFSHDLIYIFLKGIYSWPVAYGNKCSSTLIIRDIQTNNTTVRYLLIYYYETDLHQN